MESASSGVKTMHPGFDIKKLHQEAQTRWLKPSEVQFILQNHERYPLTSEPPQKPPSGSLFLFNRRVLRFFRKDGYMWRKKKDGRTLGEAHERLKVGNVDALNCYYAHGEQNPYFQRRSYWMLDPAYEHIVLVHYREVSEGRYISGSISNLSTESFSTLNQSTSISKAHFRGFTSRTGELQELYRNSSSPASVEEVSSKFAMEKSETDRLNSMDSPGQPQINQALRKLEVQLSLDDDDGNSIYVEEKLPAYCTHYEKSTNLGLSHYETRRSSEESHETLLHGVEYGMQNRVEESGKQVGYSSIQLPKLLDDEGKLKIQSLDSGYHIERKQSPSWKDMLELTSSSAGINTQGRTSNLLDPEDIPATPNCRITALESNFPSKEMLINGSDTLLSTAEREKVSEILTWQQFDSGVNDSENGLNEIYQISESDLSSQLSATKRFLLGSDNPIDSPTSISQLPEVDTSGTSTLEANSSVMMLRKDSTDWTGAIDLAIDNRTYYSELSGMWFDQNQFGNSLSTESSLTVAQKQRFSIREISPEWAFSSESTKVIITGDFLCNRSEFPWALMFGEIEVPLEIVQEGVLRCQTPPCGAGKVTLCVTSGNRESCSEIREFEFRAKPTTSNFIGTSPQTEANKSAEELLLHVRFAHILLRGYDCSSTSIGGVEQGNEHSTKDQWQQIIEALLLGCESPSETLDWILQELLKDKLQHWFMSKYQGKNGTGCLLTKQEQGIIHTISGLGYEWALNPILDSGVGINFRDANGWTSLHWAACFGREKMVAALLAAGASAGAVTDPTPQDPVGKTPGAMAASSGHTGLAGYLSEIALNSYLSSLTMEESEISKGSAAVEAERAVENVSDRSLQTHGGTEDELSLKDSLAAVRNAALAAARIQAAFRAHSFRRRRQKSAATQDDYGMTADDIHGLSAASKFQRSGHGSRDQKFDKAALSIQKKYRAWKGRNDFLILRQHVVRIQAHVRGHQAREKFGEFIRTVSVIEKVILRWRRKGVGLRGFRAEEEMIDEGEDEDIVKVFRKQKVDAVLDEAVSRVLSMVYSPEARQQYRRMLERFRQAKAQLGNADEATTRLRDDFKILGNDDYMY